MTRPHACMLMHAWKKIHLPTFLVCSRYFFSWCRDPILRTELLMTSRFSTWDWFNADKLSDVFFASLYLPQAIGLSSSFIMIFCAGQPYSTLQSFEKMWCRCWWNCFVFEESGFGNAFTIIRLQPYKIWPSVHHLDVTNWKLKSHEPVLRVTPKNYLPLAATLDHS